MAFFFLGKSLDEFKNNRLPIYIIAKLGQYFHMQQKGGEYGEIMFSLSYLPTAERLTVVVVKARNLRFTQTRETGDPFVKVRMLVSIFVQIICSTQSFNHALTLECNQ